MGLYYRVETIDLDKDRSVGGYVAAAHVALSKLLDLRPDFSGDELAEAIKNTDNETAREIFGALVTLSDIPIPDEYKDGKNGKTYCLYTPYGYSDAAEDLRIIIDGFAEAGMKSYILMYKEFDISPDEILYEDEFQIVISEETYNRHKDEQSYDIIRTKKPANERKLRPGEREARRFEKLPHRCKEMFFEYLWPTDHIGLGRNKADFIGWFNFDYPECKNPIEVILNFAFDITVFEQSEYWLHLYPQHSIKINEKEITVDFAFDTESEDCLSEGSFKPFKLAILCDECSTLDNIEEQTRKRNEIDFALKFKGYEVLHFSESQIFEKPFTCAEKILYLIYKNENKAKSKTGSKKRK